MLIILESKKKISMDLKSKCLFGHWANTSLIGYFTLISCFTLVVLHKLFLHLCKTGGTFTNYTWILYLMF